MSQAWGMGTPAAPPQKIKCWLQYVGNCGAPNIGSKRQGMQHICGIHLGRSPWLVPVSPHRPLGVEERSRFQSPLRCKTTPPGLDRCSKRSNAQHVMLPTYSPCLMSCASCGTLNRKQLAFLESPTNQHTGSVVVIEAMQDIYRGVHLRRQFCLTSECATRRIAPLREPDNATLTCYLCASYDYWASHGRADSAGRSAEGRAQTPMLCYACLALDWRRHLRCSRKKGHQSLALLATVSPALHPLSANQFSSHEFK